MKNLATIVLFAASVLIASAAQALIMDAPHNAGAGIACTDCHNYLDANGGYSDDLCLSCHNNATGGGYTKNSAPKMLTHSSANTSAKYGTWSRQCLDCHWQHNKDQRLRYGVQALFLATGTITSVTDNGNGTTTFGYNGLVEKFAGWGDYAKWNKKSWNASSGNERGLIVYPNTANLNVSFEIADATSTSVTVKGSISSGAVAAGSSFGIAYGQFINADVLAPDGMSREVKFFQNSSLYSFAFNDALPPAVTDPAPNGICQVCHSQTVYWRNDGTLTNHNSGANCVICHRHEEGFKFNCVSCHESAPPTGKHDLHFGGGSVSYGTADIQSTPAAYSFSCGICHTGTHLNTTANPRTAEVSFSGVATSDGATNAVYTASNGSVYDPNTGYTFSYSDGSCSNVYCHGNYPGSGKNPPVNFNTGTAACGSCHGATNTTPPASGSHIKHASQYNMSCSLCHKGEIGGAGPSSYGISDKQKHVNGFVDWTFDSGDRRISLSSAYNIPSGTTAPSNGTGRFYGNCSNTYCHSSGITAATLQQPVNSSARWGTSLGCTDCHTYPPDYANGSPKANSHPAHGVFACKNCHVNTTVTGYSIANPAVHVNKMYDVDPNLSSGVTLTYTFSTSGGTCANISCHGGGTAQWGATLGCKDCHLGSTDTDDFSGIFYNNETTSRIASAEWSASGHGRASGNYASGNPPAVFTTVTPTNPVDNACQFCHDGSVGHKTGANPFRLRNLSDPDWGKNGACQVCHAAASAGVSVDGVLRNGTRKIGSTHYGTRHNTTADGGQFCWDCHDPHGDVNAYMVHAEVAKTSDASTGAPLTTVATGFTSFATGADYAKNAAPFTGVCNVCHTSTDHYTATSGDGHNADSRCTTCHTHTGQTATEAFKPSCDGCHGTPPTTATYGGTTGLVGIAENNGDTGATNPLSPGAHEKHAVGRSMQCETCHKGSDMYRGVTNGKTIDIGFSIDGTTFPGFIGSASTGTLFGTDTLRSGFTWSATYSGTTVTTADNYNNTCAVYCHGAGTTDWTPLTGGSNQAPSWTGGPLQAACGTCHGGEAFNTAAASPPTTGAHLRHAGSANLGLACNKCHANTTDMGHLDGVVSWAVDTVDSRFGTLATYNSLSTGSTGTLAPSATYGSCGTIYCHSDVQDQTYGFGGPETYAAPQWGNSSSVRCGSCHNADGVQGDKSYMVSGSHAIHVDPDLMKKSCGECHNGYGEGTPRHADEIIQVAFKTNPYGVKGSYSDSPNSPGNGYGTCSNVYCHSLVQGPVGEPLKAGDYRALTWGNEGLTCNSCHADMSVSPMATGSHRKHSQDYGYGCNPCHSGAGRNTLKHSDGTVDVAFTSLNPSGMYSQTTNTPGNGYGTCSNVSCHSDGKGVYATPTWGELLNCKGCHGTQPASKVGEPGYANSGGSPNSHAKHVNVLADCNKCHSQTADTAGGIIAAGKHVNKINEVSFAAGGTYDSDQKSCSTTYCHGAGTALWGGTNNNIDCTWCHGGNAASVSPVALGNHPKHINNDAVLGTNFKCSQCHSTTTGDDDRAVTGPSHADGTKNVSFQLDGAWDSFGKNCTNVYCHSSGKGTYANPPAWTDTTTPLECNGCHGTGNALGRPDYDNAGAGQPNANSHDKHALTSADCGTCHAGTTISGTAIKAGSVLHANKSLDVTFDTAATGTGAAWTSGNKTCSNVSCHGSGSPQWGGSVNCQDCHLGSVDKDDFTGTFYNNGTASIIKKAGEWDAAGHGKATGTYVSGNPAGGFIVANACLYCHDDKVGHKTAVNPFRLKNIIDPTWGKNGACQICHATGSAGITVDGVLKNGTKKVGSTHYGTKHNTTANGGRFCWDCHDSHGDANAFMVHDMVARKSDPNTGAPTELMPASFTAFATGVDYAGGSNSAKICNTCHTSTKHYTSTTSDTHNETIRCTQCHKHTGDSATDAFKPSGDNCYDCHSSAGGQNPGTAPDANHAKHVNTAFEGKVSLGSYGSSTQGWYRYANTGGVPDMGCGYCHPQSSAAHMNGVVNLNFNPNDAGATGTLKAKNAATPVFTQDTRVSVTCSSVYCHSDGYYNGSAYGYKTTPNWYNGLYAGDKCAGCHGNSPIGSTAHGAHVVGIHYKNVFTGTTGLVKDSAGRNNAHGNAATSTTINCNVCHSSTVAADSYRNDRNTACATCHTGANYMTINSVATTHVNGTPDVAFALVNVKSRAQLGGDITSVPELNATWTRVNGYKASGSYDSAKNALNASSYVNGACSNIACHNGYSVKWTDTITCNSCHTALP